MLKIKEYPNGAWTTLDTGCLYPETKLYSPSGQLLDKMRCDTKTMAREYFKAFCKIAKTL